MESARSRPWRNDIARVRPLGAGAAWRAALSLRSSSEPPFAISAAASAFAGVQPQQIGVPATDGSGAATDPIRDTGMVAMLDVDGDGDTDLVFGNLDGSATTYYNDQGVEPTLLSLNGGISPPVLPSPALPPRSPPSLPPTPPTPPSNSGKAAVCNPAPPVRPS